MTLVGAKYAMKQGSMVTVRGSIFKWKMDEGIVLRSNKHNRSHVKGWVDVSFNNMAKEGWELFTNSQIPIY